MSVETLSFPNLIAGNFPRQTGKVTIAAGANLTAGAILGKILYDGWSWMVQMDMDPDNVGNGMAGYSGTGAAVKLGRYVFECSSEVPDAGTFSVYDPDGLQLPDLQVGQLYDSDHVKVFIEDGEVDWAVGDRIMYTPYRKLGSGKLALCDRYAVDGRDRPVAILAEDAAAAVEDVEAVVYYTGCFNSGAVSLTDGTSVSDVKTALEARNIYLMEADNNVNV